MMRSLASFLPSSDDSEDDEDVTCVCDKCGETTTRDFMGLRTIMGETFFQSTCNACLGKPSFGLGEPWSKKRSPLPFFSTPL